MKCNVKSELRVVSYQTYVFPIWKQWYLIAVLYFVCVLYRENKFLEL